MDQTVAFRAPASAHSRVICEQPGRYIGWPTIARTAEGELLVVFSGDRDAHICPFGKTFLIRSHDDGESWSTPVVINDTPLDDRDAGILACLDGTLIVSWFTSHYQGGELNRTARYLHWCPPGERARWQAHLAQITTADVARWTQYDADDRRRRIGHWIRRSTDGGRTWEAPLAVPPSTPHGPVELSDGRLLYLGTGGYQMGSPRAPHLAGRDHPGPLLVAESTDQGRNWLTIAQIDSQTAHGYLCEPHLVEVSPGGLLAMARHETRQPSGQAPRPNGIPELVRGNSTGEPPPDGLWQFESADGGCTWSVPRPTAIVGKPPHLIRLRAGGVQPPGRLLLSYGYRHPPFGQRACLSDDGGQTWHGFILRDDAPNADLGYPASVELGDGSILTVYYQVQEPGHKTCLISTRWTF
ncbi:MAG: exo-alpha-sialidase [Anaerolineae bacterium]|nr:exo-alpha-sialidase [Anaerolineae bacterium]